MTERKIVEKSRKNISYFDTLGFSDTCTNWATIDSNDTYIYKVLENTSFTFVDLKVFKFKGRKLLGTPCAIKYKNKSVS